MPSSIKKDRNLVVHSIELARVGSSMSGGEVCCLEIIRDLSRRKIDNIIYTSHNGINDYQDFLKGEKNIQFVEIDGKNSVSANRGFGIFLTYLRRVLAARTMAAEFDKDKQNVIISNSDFWPTLFYALLLKKKNPSAKWFAFNHMLAPRLFKGFRYHYSKKRFKFPSLSGIHYWINQRLFFLLAKRADCLILTNSSYRDYFKKFNKNVLHLTYASDVGNYIQKLPKIKFTEKKYDACFIGRFHEQKGIMEIADIVSRIVRVKPDFKCAMIGDNQGAIGERFIAEVKKLGIMDNFEFFGSQVGLPKYQILNNSKLFFFPSYYESFGIVYLEAISLGVPVIEYDLPIFQDHKSGVVKIPFLNNQKFADRAVDLLADEEHFIKLSHEAVRYSESFSWHASSQKLYEKF